MVSMVVKIRKRVKHIMQPAQETFASEILSMIPERMSLELKPLTSDDGDSVRIYRITEDACGKLNNYLLDFYGSISILRENLERFSNTGNREKALETLESIRSVIDRIREVTDSMEKINQDMPFLVEIRRYDE